MTLMQKPAVKILAFALTATISLATGSALAEDSNKDLGEYKKWQAHSYVDAGAKVCNMWSEPTKHEEGGKQRGQIFAFITHRASSKRFHEVSFDMGYPLKSGSEVTVKIGSKTFKLFTQDSSAFAFKEDDKALVKAMRGGSTMIVTGESQRGTKTKDTYSLSGFTKAHNTISKACKAGKL
ncbi:invasion associated locus B family protein [Aestuariispira insulae]|uniref:Invasion associated locus B (IalB) protein n=1 Tax=Aestuariispira insulae TaxID=1461337 RepID=A0A3D9HJN4_9PROT|nr:invasion associated locus B family protein [Aestuariispira insulae]RED49126.1 invasion associated locus B (IalB) protein [Aestuariispira insulae]